MLRPRHPCGQMDRNAADLVMILTGVTAVVLLVAWGLLAAAGTAGFDPVFWLLAAAFIVYIGWDTRRHLKAIRTRTKAREGRNP